MREYTIKNTVDELTARDFSTLTRFYIYYELSGLELDFNDDFINCIYNYYIESNYENTCNFCAAVYDYFYFNNIDPASVKTLDDLKTILRDID